MPGEQFRDERQSAARRRGASFDSFINALEVVPGERLDIRAQNNAGIAVPVFELVGGHDSCRNTGIFKLFRAKYTLKQSGKLTMAGPSEAATERYTDSGRRRQWLEIASAEITMSRHETELRKRRPAGRW